jgi:membrane protease YdiL (CAAX protease family)
MAVILAAILFSAVHGQFFGFIPRFLLGVLFGYLMIWSKTIWVPVLAHFFNNAIAVTLYYLYGQGKISLNPDELGGEIFGGKVIVMSLVLLSTGVYLIYRRERKKG